MTGSYYSYNSHNSYNSWDQGSASQHSYMTAGMGTTAATLGWLVMKDISWYVSKTVYDIVLKASSLLMVFIARCHETEQAPEEAQQ